jgi:hypothetical protein
MVVVRAAANHRDTPNCSLTAPPNQCRGQSVGWVDGRGNPPGDNNSGRGSGGLERPALASCGRALWGVRTEWRLRRTRGQHRLRPGSLPGRAGPPVRRGSCGAAASLLGVGTRSEYRFAGARVDVRVPVRRGRGTATAASPGSPGGGGDQDFAHTRGAGSPAPSRRVKKRTRPPGVTPTGEQ